MKYKVIKGLTSDPYRQSLLSGDVLDTDKHKLSKELIDRAIREKRIALVQDKPKAAPVPKKVEKVVKESLTPEKIVPVAKVNKAKTFGQRK